MKKVLMSIKPEFANSIFEGTKLYEYRKYKLGRKDIVSVVVYATEPVSKIIGEFDIEKVLEETPQRLWELTHNGSGITEEFFYKYFENRNVSFAYKISNPQRYSEPRLLSDCYPGVKPPQTHRYVDE